MTVRHIIQLCDFCLSCGPSFQTTCMYNSSQGHVSECGYTNVWREGALWNHLFYKQAVLCDLTYTWHGFQKVFHWWEAMFWWIVKKYFVFIMTKLKFEMTGEQCGEWCGFSCSVTTEILVEWNTKSPVWVWPCTWWLWKCLLCTVDQQIILLVESKRLFFLF
jgi:hypothetical protein